MRKRKQNKRARLLALIGTAAFLLACVLLGAVLFLRGGVFTGPEPEAPQYPLTVAFLDVGQGDAAVIRCGETTLVIDGGEAAASDVTLDYLKRQGVRTVDCYIATHPHMDHIGAAAEILRAMDVKSVMATPFSDLNVPTTVTYENFLTATGTEGCEVLEAWAGASFTFGELKLDVLAPFVETGDYNNMSIVLLMTFRENRFLFMGDAESEVEYQLLDDGAPLNAQVLKVGHHGSSDASGDSFIAAVAPEIAVISCGRNNDFGHPHRLTLETLRKYGCTICRTDTDGTVTVCGDGTEVVLV